MGPHQAYGNIPRSIEYAVDWVSNCVQYLDANNITRIEPTSKGVQEWTEHVHDISKGFLTNNVDSWSKCPAMSSLFKTQRHHASWVIYTEYMLTYC